MHKHTQWLFIVIRQRKHTDNTVIIIVSLFLSSTVEKHTNNKICSKMLIALGYRSKDNVLLCKDTF